MNSLKEYGFKISAEKSTWIATEVELLGYVVSGNSIKINPLKIATIRDRPEPKNAKEVQQVLGLFNFYRRFIENFAENSKPLYSLIAKNTKFEWTDTCKKHYKYFVQCITSEPAMAQPILGQPFIVYSDGSFNPSRPEELQQNQAEPITVQASTPPYERIVGFRKDVPTFSGASSEDYSQWLFSIKRALKNTATTTKRLY